MSTFRGRDDGDLRKLPVYLLLDCSASMSGSPIQAVNQGVGTIYTELCNNPRALSTVKLSVITFSGNATFTPPVALDQFVPPTLVANGGTPLGGALRALADSIDRDLDKTTKDKKGDYCPIVFLLTDGYPTDDYTAQANRIRQFTGSQKPMIIALGCGGGADEAMLKNVAQHVFLMHNVTPEEIRKFFVWLTGSIKQASNAVVANGDAPISFAAPTDMPSLQYTPGS